MSGEHDPSARGGGCGRGILRVFAWMFLLGFMVNAIQLFVLGAAEIRGGEPLPLLENQSWLTGISAAASLLIAIILFRNSRRSR